MKKLLLLLLLTTFCVNAQVGIGTTAPDAALDVTSTNDGLLLPRVALTSTTDATSVLTLTTSELVYNTATVSDVTPGYYYWNGTLWVRVSTGSNWSLVGNAATTPGTWAAPGTNFLGTTDAQDFFIRSNNVNRARFLSDGRVEFGAITSSTPSKYYFENSDLLTIGLYNNYAPGVGLPGGAKEAFHNVNDITDAAFSGQKTGMWNEVTSTGTGPKVGLLNRVSTTAAMLSSGNVNAVTNSMSLFSPDTGNSHRGISNLISLSNTGRGNVYGYDNQISTTAALSANIETIAGLRNVFTLGTDGPIYGAQTTFTASAMANGTIGNKYGYSVVIPSVNVGGTHYGIFSDVRKAGSYAGYFLGNLSVGTAAGNEYILPPSRGTAGQTMVSDGSGNVTWTTPTTSDPSVQAYNYTADAASFSITNAMYTVRIGTSATPIVAVTLPDPTLNTGKVFYIITMSGVTANFTVTGGSSVLNSMTNAVITFQVGARQNMYQSDGTNWLRIL